MKVSRRKTEVNYIEEEMRRTRNGRAWYIVIEVLCLILGATITWYVARHSRCESCAHTYICMASRLFDISGGVPFKILNKQGQDFDHRDCGSL
jgi:hypothetical protein